MRICLLGDVNSIHLQRWAELTLARGHDVAVFSIYAAATDWSRAPTVHISGWEHGGAGTSRVPFAHQLGQFLAISRHIRAALREFGPDIVHAHFATDYGWPALVGGVRPYVITTWGSDVYGLQAVPLTTRLLTLVALRNASAVTGDSSDLIRATARLGVKRQRLHSLHVGVDTRLFRADDTQHSRALLGLPRDAQIILSPRGLQRQYNLEALLHAVAELTPEFPKLLLVQKCYLVQPVFEHSMRQLVARLGLQQHVQFVPSTAYEEVPRLLNAADVVVSLATTDSSPVSVLEALACGRVVVASDVPSVREWIQDRKNGFLTAPTDAAAIADRLRAALGVDQATRLVWGTENARLIHERADQENQMDALERLYSSLLGARGSRRW